MRLMLLAADVLWVQKMGSERCIASLRVTLIIAGLKCETSLSDASAHDLLLLIASQKMRFSVRIHRKISHLSCQSRKMKKRGESS